MWPWGRRHGRHTIDGRLAAEVHRGLGDFHVHVKELPQYRFVDLYRATLHEARALGVMATVESDHRQESLHEILHTRAPRWLSRRVALSTRIAWATGPDEQIFLPVDTFWVCAPSESRAPLIARVFFHARNEKPVLQVASPDVAVAEAFVTAAGRRADAESIYRRRVLALRFEPATRDEYGDVEKPEQLRVLFAPEPRLDDDDIVMEPNVERLLWRNVVDLHLRRDLLKAHGVPVRRGVLLYGPPGTGKTFATRYLCAKLRDATRIVVAGSALQHVTAVFALARMLQPALVILEDVDLVFTTREATAQGAILGELLDQMDGLRPHEDVGVVLTTNAIDRIEAAIKDRPGRISQCIHLGPPNAELRRRYLTHYLAPYVITGVDIGALVARSAGTTQACLKDWVHRSVQLASADDKVELRTQDFDVALREARGTGPGASGRIIGFLGDSSG
jgi:hypothetical protein